MSETSSSKSKKSCAHPSCSKKLHLADLECRCGKKFCSAHRYAEEHACTFDYRKLGMAQLSTTVVKCVAEKLETIA